MNQLTLSTDEVARLKEIAWYKGELKWKLKPHQFSVYDSIKANKSLKFVIACARRFGKSFILCLYAIEQCLKNANYQVRFAAPTVKALKKIVIPIFKIILNDCPKTIKPEFIYSEQIWRFANGSEIHLAGTDFGNAENLRGTASDLNIIDEAGSCDNLWYLYKDILLPQTLTTGGVTLLASTPAITPGHDYYQISQDAKEQGAYIKFTVWDNTSLTKEQIEEYAEESGGISSTTFRREYLCEDVVESEMAIVPEWDETKYAIKTEKPRYYEFFDKYTALDIGVRHYTALIFGYYDFTKATFIIEKECKVKGSSVTTDEIARLVKENEIELWGNQRPYKRVSDNNNLILINDLLTKHDLPFIATTKDNLHAMVNNVRMWTKSGRINVEPSCKYTIGCLNQAVWNPNRTMMAESRTLGHFDALAALIYLIRNVDEHHNPIPNYIEYNQSKAHIPHVNTQEVHELSKLNSRRR